MYSPSPTRRPTPSPTTRAPTPRPPSPAPITPVPTPQPTPIPTVQEADNGVTLEPSLVGRERPSGRDGGVFEPTIVDNRFGNPTLYRTPTWPRWVRNKWRNVRRRRKRRRRGRRHKRGGAARRRGFHE